MSGDLEAKAGFDAAVSAAVNGADDAQGMFRDTATAGLGDLYLAFDPSGKYVVLTCEDDTTSPSTVWFGIGIRDDSLN
jgi:hypothetical protein